MLTVLTPAPSQALASLETVKAELGIADASSDATLTRLIEQASDEMASFCDRQFMLETVREVFALECFAFGDGLWRMAGEPLLVARRPVVELIGITDDDGSLAPTDYEIDLPRGRIWRRAGGMRTGWYARRLTVEYRGGYAPGEVPPALERICIDLVKRSYFTRGRDPALRSEEVPGIISQTFTASSSEVTAGGVPQDIADRLWRFRDLA